MPPIHQLALTLALGSFLVTSCREKPLSEKHPSAPAPDQQESLASAKLTHYFPLLPVVEKQLWRQLLNAEATLADPALLPEEHATAAQKIEKIAQRLRPKSRPEYQNSTAYVPPESSPE